MYDLLVIGGGIAGLSFIHHLIQENSHIKLLLLEKGDHVGGKLQTVYQDNNHDHDHDNDNENQKKVLYETGPWRLSTSHRLMLKLCHELGIQIDPIQTGVEKYYPLSPTKPVPLAIPELSKKDGALSVYDQWMLLSGVSTANLVENETGYHGILDMASTIDAYEAQNKSPLYVSVREGFSAVTQRLCERIPSKNIKTGYFVTNVQWDSHQKRYGVEVQIRRGPNKFLHKKILSKQIVLACPPSAIFSWDIYRHVAPINASVSTCALHHIYAKGNPEILKNKNFHLTTANPLSQIISSVYHNEWFQISYCGGRMADYWERLRLAHPQKFRHEILKCLEETTGIQSKTIGEIRNYYWQQAIHLWNPCFGFAQERLARLAAHPHPFRLPGLYVIGEAFSCNQGWCEGALETVNYLLNLISQKKKEARLELIPLPKYHVVYDGRVLDVERWMNVHPGSKEAIQNHLGEDVTQLWNSIHTSSSSKNLIACLQVGWFHDDKKMYKI